MFLQLPFCTKESIIWVDSLFTAISAVSTTGLVVVNISEVFSFFGQLVLLLLMQVGGILYLVANSYLILNIKQTILSFRGENYSENTFPIKKLILHAIFYTAVCEIIGCAVLYFIFSSSGTEAALWQAIFHSVSSFCTTGLSLFPSNLENYATHLGMNAILSLLSLFGAIGFFLWIHFFMRAAHTKKREGFIARISRSVTSLMILSGALLFLLTTTFFSQESQFQKILISLFHTISAVTTVGFNTIDLGAQSQIPSLILIFLMLYGAFLTGSCLSIPRFSFFKFPIKNQNRTALDQHLHSKKMQVVIAIVSTYLLVLFTATLFLLMSETHSWLSLLFEAASALCSVGLSLGITSELSSLGKCMILLLMFMGRVGILILGYVVATRLFSKREGLYTQKTF